MLSMRRSGAGRKLSCSPCCYSHTTLSLPDLKQANAQRGLPSSYSNQRLRFAFRRNRLKKVFCS
jgi:hypothetical protein